MRVSSRGLGFLVVASILLLLPAPTWAHRGEPISTEFALPFAPGTGNWKIQYAFEHTGPGASEQAIPETEIELGLFPRFQVNAGVPLRRTDAGPGEPAHIFGGKLELGARYLLFGGEHRRYAVSVQAEAEAPTGSRELAGDAPELGAGIFMDRFLGRNFALHSNLLWKTTVGGRQEVERTFQYDHALVWFRSHRWAPVIELNGETETATGATQLALQPEVILFAGHHLELKAGTPIGLTASSPDVGFRFQLAIIWGVE